MPAPRSSSARAARRAPSAVAPPRLLPLRVWAAAAFGAALLAAVADAAHPPLPTPCIAGACGAAAPSFVQYGKAAATVSGTTMNVNQSSAQAILNWADFNIAHGYTVNFHQPSATAAALNEIWSASPSTIAGALI